MAIVERKNMRFDIDLEATKEYYRKRTPIAGVVMQNFEKQAYEAAPLLRGYLEEFGIDIQKPDELCWEWQDEKNILHYNVAYTVTGKIIKSAQRQSGKSLKTVQNEIILLDKSKIHIVLEEAYIPNEQTKNYFGFTVYNIEMPWIMEEEYPKRKSDETAEESIIDIILEKLKKIKKYWTK